MRSSCALIALISAAAAVETNETAKWLASDGGQGHDFGYSVAVSGNRVVVGARYADGNSPDSGAAYVFDLITGAEIHKLIASDGETFDAFGVSVAIDGTMAVVGASFDGDNGVSSGSAYLFDATSGVQLFKLLASDGEAWDQLGVSVALDGGLALVGATGDADNGSGSGSAYLFDVTSGMQLAKLLPTDGDAGDEFGSSVALCGPRAVVGAFGDEANGLFSGSAYVFDTGTGTQLAKLLPADGGTFGRFGCSVALEGTTALIGSWGDDEAGTMAGAAYVFDLITGQQTGKLLPLSGSPGELFGTSVALYGGGALIGAPGDGGSGQNSGAAYHFDASSGLQLARLVASDGEKDDYLGLSVAVTCNAAVVGAPFEDAGGAEAGAVYRFDVSAAPPTAYCTAGASASGCRATLSATGTPSASASSGFVIQALSVEGAKDGLFFFGTGGRQANPWGNGTSYQCVVPPVKRGGLLQGTGSSGVCDGAFTQDLNALWCPTCPGWRKNPGEGAVVQAQLWYRDPFSTSNARTAFSDALEFCLAP